MADKKTKSVMDMVRKKVAERAKLRQQAEQTSDAPQPDPAAEEERRKQEQQWEQEAQREQQAQQEREAAERQRQEAQQEQARLEQQREAQEAERKQAEKAAAAAAARFSVDPELDPVLARNTQGINSLFARYATQGVEMDFAQLTSLAANHNIIPEPFEMSVAEAMFNRCASSSGQGRFIDSNGFFKWLAIAARELRTRGIVQQVCPESSNCLELLLARMDSSGAMFGAQIQQKYGGTARDLQRYTVSYSTGRAEPRQQQHAASSPISRPSVGGRARGPTGRRSSAYEPTASYQAKRYSAEAASSPTTQHLNTKLAALHKQVQDEQTKELTFKPNINQKYAPKGSFEERMSKAEEARRLKLVRMKQEEYEREEASMHPSQAMNSRSKKLLEKKGQLHVKQEVHVSKMHSSKTIHMKKWQKENRNRASVDQETGQPLFQPVVNPMAGRALKDRHGTGHTDVSESLYRNAMNRKVRHQMAAKQIELNHQDLRNSVKMNASSFTFIRKRLVREVQHMFSLYDSDSEGSLNYTRMIEMLRDLGILKNTPQTNTLQRQNELRTERSRLLRLWSDLVLDGSSGVTVQAITQFVLAVVLGVQNLAGGGGGAKGGGGVDIDRQLVAEFRTEYLSRTKHNPRGTFTFVDGGGVSGSSLYNDRASDEECTFQPMICDRSRKLDPNTRRMQQGHEPLNREDLLLEKARAAEDRAAAARQRKAEEEMAECTFAPVINHYYYQEAAEGEVGSAVLGGAQQPRSELLYQNYLRKKAATDEGFIQQKTTLDQEVEAHCTFQPQITASMSTRGYQDPQTASVPRGYARDIERMRAATKKREQEKLEREEMGRSIGATAKSSQPRSKAVKPFAFASELRSIKRKEQRKERARAKQTNARVERAKKEKVRTVPGYPCIDAESRSILL